MKSWRSRDHMNTIIIEIICMSPYVPFKAKDIFIVA